MSCCHFRLVGSLSSERHAASKLSTCMTRNKSCSLLKMEYSEIPTSFNLDSKAGQTFRCAASYSASLPAFIRNRNATLGNWTSHLRTPWFKEKGNSGFIVGEKARNGVPFLPVLILSERSSPSRVRFPAPKKRRALDCCGPL